MGLKCNLCGSENIKKHLQKGDLHLYKCKSCGLVFLYPQPNLDYNKDYFDDYGGKSYLEKAKSKALSSVKFLEKIDGYVNLRGVFSEIGSATGFLLKEAKGKGWKTIGVEKSKWARDYAKKHFDIVSYENIDEVNLKADAVIMLNTIEHLNDPQRTIQDLYDIMEKGSPILITTPNINNIRYIFTIAFFTFFP